MLDKITQFVKDNHVVQFLLTIVILVMYFVTFIQGHPSTTLENFAVIAVAFFFVNTSNVISVSNGKKIDEIKTKLDSQEVKRTDLAKAIQVNKSE